MSSCTTDLWREREGGRGKTERSVCAKGGGTVVEIKDGGKEKA